MAKIIFMIHGMMCGGWVWDNYKEYFEARGYKCVCPTLRYHDLGPDGLLDSRLGTASLLDYAGDLESEIKKLSQPPIIMGHSMGGLLAQILGARGLADALVLLAPAPPHGISMLKLSVLKCIPGSFLRWGCWRRPLKLPFAKAAYAIYNRMPAEEQRELYSRMVYESGRAVAEIALSLFDERGAARVDQARVKCPVLVIAGREDRITPAGVVAKIAGKYGDMATCQEFANHAHWVLGEPGWEEIAEYVHGWLKRKA